MKNRSVNRLSRAAGLTRREPPQPQLPAGQRLYAIGDIHGCLQELRQILNEVRYDSEDVEGETHIIFLGDYIDRGPDSKGVIETLRSVARDFPVTCLLGNHDQTLLDFLETPAVFRDWRCFGAPETLLSYGVQPPRFDDAAAFAQTRDDLVAALPPEHVIFLKNLKHSVTFGDYFFVHAGVRPGIPLDRQDEQDLLWIREEFLNSRTDFGRVVVHGHTPSEKPVRKANRIGIDTGAYATGRLTAAVLERSSCRFIET